MLLLPVFARSRARPPGSVAGPHAVEACPERRWCVCRVRTVARRPCRGSAAGRSETERRVRNRETEQRLACDSDEHDVRPFDFVFAFSAFSLLTYRERDTTERCQARPGGRRRAPGRRAREAFTILLKCAAEISDLIRRPAPRALVPDNPNPVFFTSQAPTIGPRAPRFLRDAPLSQMRSICMSLTVAVI